MRWLYLVLITGHCEYPLSSDGGKPLTENEGSLVNSVSLRHKDFLQSLRFCQKYLCRPPDSSVLQEPVIWGISHVSEERGSQYDGLTGHDRRHSYSLCEN